MSDIDALFATLEKSPRLARTGLYRNEERLRAAEALGRLRDPAIAPRAWALLTPDLLAVRKEKPLDMWAIPALADKVHRIVCLLVILSEHRYMPAFPRVLELARGKDGGLRDEARIAFFYFLEDAHFRALFRMTREQFFAKHTIEIAGHRMRLGTAFVNDTFDDAWKKLGALFPKGAKAAKAPPPPEPAKRAAKPIALSATNAAARSALPAKLIAAAGTSRRFGAPVANASTLVARAGKRSIALPPSLRAWLAFDTRFLAKVTEGALGRPGAIVATTMERAIPRRRGTKWKGLDELFPGPAIHLGGGSDSAAILYLGEPNIDGEGFVVSADWDDTESLFYDCAGFDAWLASALGEKVPAAAQRRFDAVTAAITDRFFAGGRALERTPAGFRKA